MRIANQILDAYDDIYKEELTKLAEVAPEVYIKTAEELKSLKDTDFALSVITKEAHRLNKFPIGDPHDTWLSNVFFEKNSHKLPKEAAEIAAGHIKEACDKYKITPSARVKSLAKKASSNVYYERDGDIHPVRLQKTASMSELAEAEKIASNYTFAQYAFPTPQHVNMGLKYFEKFASKLPLEVRHGYAEALQKRANELGMEDLKGEITKYASDSYGAMIGAHIRSRVSLLDGKDPKYSATLSKLAASRKEFAPSEFARALHSFDKHAGLTRYYGSHLTEPYQATFASQPDKYAGYRVKTASGKSLTPDQIKMLATSKYDKIKEYFGKSLADELKKDPTSIFESLPMDAKEVLVGISNDTV